MQNTLAPWGELVGDPRHPLTPDDLSALPDDGWRYELVEGRLVRMPGTGLEHLEVTDNLHAALRAYVKANRLGLVTLPDTAFRLVPDTVLMPDIGFLGLGKTQALPAWGSQARKKYIPFAPDLAVEVASPDQHRREMGDKARLYLQFGAGLIWVIWPADQADQQVDVWLANTTQPATQPATAVLPASPTQTLGMGQTLDGLTIVPGLMFAVADLFQPFV